VRLWDPHTRQQIGELTDHINKVWSVAFGPNGTLLATDSKDDAVRLWDAHTHQQIGPPLTGATDGSSVAFSPDGTILATGGENNTVLLWKLARPR
jgi:WD40 repeat protein